jgi:leucyl aminopeptidase
MNKNTTKFSVITKNIIEEKADLLIVGIYENKKLELSPLVKAIDEKLNGNLTVYIEEEKFEAKISTSLVLSSLGKANFKKVLLIGLGKQQELKDLDQIRKITASAIRKADSLKAETVNISLFGLDSASKETINLNAPQIARSIAEVSLLANYKFEKYLTTKDKNKDSESDKNDKFTGIQKINLFVGAELNDAELKKQVEIGIASTEGVLLARELIIEPPNIATPTYLAETAKRIAKDQKGLTLKVLGKAECEKLGMGAFLAVARGSVEEPKLIHFHYKPISGKAKKHIAIVGKGITFDSGGLSLKPAKAMEKMKYDMAGAASVIGLMSIISKIEPQLEITAVIAACENMPSGDAYRPGDILTSMSGKTMEINNTDAEGRVTLADSVFYACEQKPDQIIDIATLTGAIVVSLGETAAGLMSNNPELAEEVKKAFNLAGEKVWELPLYEDYESSVTKGTIADMLNAGSGGQAGSQNGALFVKQFVGKTPWVHLDIAGTCWPEKKDTCFTPKNNPAGYGVLGFVRHLENLSS